MAETVEVLERAVEAPEIVRALKPYGVTQSDIAAATGVSDRAVRGWQSSVIRPERYDRLSELRDIVLLLSETLTPRGVGQWLHARNRLLGGKRPVELLKRGKVEDVRRAAAAFADGSYV
jgi:transcriptional regulator with XRE-family HTH domain